VAGFDSVVRVDLNLVVFLSVRKERENKEHRENPKGTQEMWNATRKP
jgi:hypothetical protein